MVEDLFFILQSSTGRTRECVSPAEAGIGLTVVAQRGSLIRLHLRLAMTPTDGDPCSLIALLMDTD